MPEQVDKKFLRSPYVASQYSYTVSKGLLFFFKNSSFVEPVTIGKKSQVNHANTSEITCTQIIFQQVSLTRTISINFIH